VIVVNFWLRILSELFQSQDLIQWSEYGVAWQECHQLLRNVLNHAKFLVKDNKTSTAGEPLGVIALQMMEIAL
jgi:hypothetical protein